MNRPFTQNPIKTRKSWPKLATPIAEVINMNQPTFLMRDLPTFLVLAGWFWVLFLFDIFEPASPLALPAFAVLYAASCIGLYRMSKAGRGLSAPVLAMCAFIAVFATFTLWGLILGNISLPPLPDEWPKFLKITAFFLLGPVVALALGLILFYPLTKLFPKYFWAIPVTAAVIVGLIQYEGVVDERGSTISRGLILFELACLILLVPIFIDIFRRTWVSATRKIK